MNKRQHTTMAIGNADKSADMKVITLNKHISNRTVKCLEIAYLSYLKPLALI